MFGVLLVVWISVVILFVLVLGCVWWIVVVILLVLSVLNCNNWYCEWIVGSSWFGVWLISRKIVFVGGFLRFFSSVLVLFCFRLLIVLISMRCCGFIDGVVVNSGCSVWICVIVMFCVMFWLGFLIFLGSCVSMWKLGCDFVLISDWVGLLVGILKLVGSLVVFLFLVSICMLVICVNIVLLMFCGFVNS